MPSAYPGSIRVWSTKKNITDDVDASHVNDLQDEMYSVQNTLGISPHMSSFGGYTTVAARLAGIEVGTNLPVISGGFTGTITNAGTDQNVSLTSEAFDPLNWFTPGATWQCPILRDGFYRISAYALMQSATAAGGVNWAQFTIASNGVGRAKQQAYFPAGISPQVGLSVTWSGAIYNGGTVTFLGAQNGGGSRTVQGNWSVEYIRGGI